MHCAQGGGGGAQYIYICVAGRRALRPGRRRFVIVGAGCVAPRAQWGGGCGGVGAAGLCSVAQLRRRLRGGAAWVWLRRALRGAGCVGAGLRVDAMAAAWVTLRALRCGGGGVVRGVMQWRGRCAAACVALRSVAGLRCGVASRAAGCSLAPW